MSLRLATHSPGAPHAPQDAATYIISALCATQIPGPMGEPGFNPHGTGIKAQEEECTPVRGGAPAPVAGAAAGAPAPSSPALLVPVPAHGDLSALSELRSDELPRRPEGAGGALLRSHLLGTLSGIAEGWAFVLAPENRDILGIATIKAAGAISWGAIDIVNVGVGGGVGVGSEGRRGRGLFRGQGGLCPVDGGRGPPTRHCTPSGSCNPPPTHPPTHRSG